jgi:hypothetical protein
MKNRCYYPGYHAYKHYGGRGIKIIPEWRYNFAAFYDWAISHGHKDNLTIDRINVNGNYEPSNCRWATMAEQNQNKRVPNGTKIKEDYYNGNNYSESDKQGGGRATEAAEYQRAAKQLP